MKKRKFISLVIAFTLIFTAIFNVRNTMQTNAATTTCNAYDGSNIGTQNYDRWASVIDSYLTLLSDGKLMRVQNTAKDGVIAEYYDTSYNFISDKKIAAELPIFGGFYASADNYFLVTGQTNRNQSASVEVVRITKYDKNWNRISSTGLYDCNTTVPFDAGSLRMDMLGKYLLIRTCHEMYRADDGYNHQSNMTIQVDTNTMTITDSYSGVMNTGWGYASHSFNQFIKMDGNKIVAVDHGDAYPRSIALFKYATDASTGKFVPTYNKQCTVVDIFTIPGAIGENATNTTIGGFEISDSAYLVAGNSVVQDNNNLNRSTRNVYVAAVNKSNNAVTMNWLTSYSEGDGTTSTPHMIKINQNKYIVMWTRDDIIYYAQVDGSGKKTGSTYTMDGKLSDCMPIVVNNKLVWYTWDDGQIIFYEISLSNLSNTNEVVINNGHDYTHNGVTNGVSKLTCKTCGAVTEMTVPTSMSVWWREESGAYGSYSSAFNSNKNVGDTMYCWITFSPENVNKDFRLTSDNPNVMSITRTSDTNNVMFELVMKGAGTATITATHKYNPNLTRTYKITVNSRAAIELNGFQISSVSKGYRTVYSVSDPAKEVVSAGLVYGLANYAKSGDMVVGSSNKYVYDFSATNTGKLDSTFSSMNNATSYVMTMQFGACTPEFFETPLMIRAYAKLNNGTYIYSDVVNCKVYDIADKLYKNNWMNNEASHNYLYNDILKKVNSDYKKITFKSGNSLVTP